MDKLVVAIITVGVIVGLAVVYLISMAICALLARLANYALSYSPKRVKGYRIPIFIVYCYQTIATDKERPNTLFSSSAFIPLWNMVVALIGILILFFYPIWLVGALLSWGLGILVDFGYKCYIQINCYMHK
jgi:ABC-type antimicrobial peptide transport system permease subunit